MLRSPEQDHAPKPLPPPPAFLPPFLSFLPPFFPASNTSAAGGPSSAAVVGRCRAGALGAAAGADGAGRAPASATSMGSTAAPASPRATHCCVTHLVSAASSAVWSDLQGRGSAGSRAECLCRQANVQQWHRSTTALSVVRRCAPRVGGAISECGEEEQGLPLARLHRQVQHVEACGAALQDRGQAQGTAGTVGPWRWAAASRGHGWGRGEAGRRTGTGN